MPRLAPRIGVSLLVTLLFGPLSSMAHDSDDKSFEGKWAVIVAGHITWNGEDHRDCVHRATETRGQCVRTPPQQGASNGYCPEVTPGTLVPPALCSETTRGALRSPHKDDSDRTKGDSDRTKGDSDRTKGDSDRTKGDSDRTKGDSDRTKGDSDRTKGDSDR
jgi:hypothetical protein